MEKRVKEISNFIDKTLQNREKEMSMLKDQLLVEKKNIDIQRKKMEEALEIGAVMEYREAKIQETALRDVVQAYEERVGALDKKALITKEDYENRVKVLLDLGEELKEEIQAKLKTLSESMEEETDMFFNKINEINATLKRLQEDVYRNADNKYGVSNKEVKTEDIPYWGYSAVKSAGYKTYTGRKEE